MPSNGTPTSKLSAAIESLLTSYVAEHQSRQQLADIVTADWNAVHAVVGSFADEHSTL